MKLTQFTAEKFFIKETIELMESICAKKKGVIYIALSGGTTPEKIYRAFRTSRSIPWERVIFFIVDERYVPLKHKDSNFRMIESSLGAGILRKTKDFLYFHTELPLQKSLEKYEKDLKKSLKQKFDLVILGIGPDGHTASLFPKSPALRTKKMVAHTTTTEFKIKDRLTLTFPILMKSDNILLLLKGKEKKTTLDTFLHKKVTVENFPAKQLLKHKKLTIHFLYNG